MKIFLDTTKLVLASQRRGVTLDMVAFLRQCPTTFRILADELVMDEHYKTATEDALASGRIMLRNSTEDEPSLGSFKQWLQKWFPEEFRDSDFDHLSYYDKDQAKVAMDKSGRYDEHAIFA